MYNVCVGLALYLLFGAKEWIGFILLFFVFAFTPAGFVVGFFLVASWREFWEASRTIETSASLPVTRTASTLSQR